MTLLFAGMFLNLAFVFCIVFVLAFVPCRVCLLRAVSVSAVCVSVCCLCVCVCVCVCVLSV